MEPTLPGSKLAPGPAITFCPFRPQMPRASPEFSARKSCHSRVLVLNAAQEPSAAVLCEAWRQAGARQAGTPGKGRSRAGARQAEPGPPRPAPQLSGSLEAHAGCQSTDGLRFSYCSQGLSEPREAGMMTPASAKGRSRPSALVPVRWVHLGTRQAGREEQGASGCSDQHLLPQGILTTPEFQTPTAWPRERRCRVPGRSRFLLAVYFANRGLVHMESQHLQVSSKQSH